MNLKAKCASDLMVSNIVKATVDETLRTAMRRMHDKKVRCLLVDPTEKGGGFGIACIKDIVQLFDEDDEDILEDMTIGDVMTKPAICVQGDMQVLDCLTLMRMTGVRRVPVLQGSELLGLISYTDIFTHVAKGV